MNATSPATLVRAVWADLAIVSRAVPDAVLAPLLRPGLELDHRQGQAHASLVAFRFLHTHMLGVGAGLVPGLGEFPQWNLRFYVRTPGRPREVDERGIVFVREFVPLRFVAATVRAFYNEPYSAAPLTCRVTQAGPLRRIRYDLSAGGGRHALAVSALGPPHLPQTDSAETFFTGQGWGFGRGRRGEPTGFRVTHAPWRVYNVVESLRVSFPGACTVTGFGLLCSLRSRDFVEAALRPTFRQIPRSLLRRSVVHWHLSVDFERLYGSDWAFLAGRAPDSGVLCEGSAVSVSGCLCL